MFIFLLFFPSHFAFFFWLSYFFIVSSFFFKFHKFIYRCLFSYFFIPPILHFFFFCYLIFSLCHLSSLSSTSLFIDVYFPTSLLLAFCIFLLLFFFSSCHLSHLSSTSLLQVVSQMEVFTFLSFFFGYFHLFFKLHVVTYCFFDLISF
jgi:hypothetical protein